MNRIILYISLLGGVVADVRRSKYGCEGTLVYLECEQGKYISPVRANFGRFDSGICNPGGNKVWSTRCIQPTTLRHVNSVCQGKRSCSIDVTSSVFGDPCPDTYKYLEVHYTCQTEVSTPRAENNLPPWLLKMSATTTKPSHSTTTLTFTTPTTTPQPVEDTVLLVEEMTPEITVSEPESLLEKILDLEENLEYENSLEDLLGGRREVFINLPLQEPEVETLEVGEEKTVLIATLVSVLSCTLVILTSAILYTRINQRRKKENARKEIIISTLNPAKFQNYSSPHHESIYDYESVSSGSSTVSSVYTSIPSLGRVGSLYSTTLPNGDQAIIIPISSLEQGYFQHLQSSPGLRLGAVPAYSLTNSNLYAEVQETSFSWQRY